MVGPAPDRTGMAAACLTVSCPAVPDARRRHAHVRRHTQLSMRQGPLPHHGCTPTPRGGPSHHYASPQPTPLLLQAPRTARPTPHRHHPRHQQYPQLLCLTRAGPRSCSSSPSSSAQGNSIGWHSGTLWQWWSTWTQAARTPSRCWGGSWCCGGMQGAPGGASRTPARTGASGCLLLSNLGC